MPKIPRISGKELIRRLEALGYVKSRQRGSHVRLECVGRKKITVPDYSQEISPGLFRKIMRDGELTTDECKKILAPKK